jgi:hypothetical protein
VRGEAAVAGVSGKERAVAKVFHPLPAISADAASVCEPGNSDPVADPVHRHITADAVDAADNLMARHDRIFDIRKLRIDDMEVGSADPARAHLDPNLSFARLGIDPLLHLEGRPRRRQHHRTHSCFSKQETQPERAPS